MRRRKKPPMTDPKQNQTQNEVILGKSVDNVPLVRKVFNARMRVRNFPRELEDVHKGQTAIIFGDGPSVGDYDLSDPFFTENITLGCNHIGKHFQPSYYALNGFYYARGLLHLVRPPSKLIRYLRYHPKRPGFENALIITYWKGWVLGPPTKGILYHSRKSGTMLLHVAYQMGFSRYFMLGIDGYLPGELNHHNSEERITPKHDYEELIQEFLRLFVEKVTSEGGEVWNLSQRSVYKAVPKCTLEDAKSMT